MGGAHPKKNQKKTKPIYQFWCNDWFFGFFWVFLVFFVFFWFFGFFWDGILTLNSNTKKTEKSQKIPSQKNKKTKRAQKTSVQCWPRLLRKKPKNQCQFGNFKKTKKKKQKNPKKILEYPPPPIIYLQYINGELYAYLPKEFFLLVATEFFPTKSNYFVCGGPLASLAKWTLPLNKSDSFLVKIMPVQKEKR